MTTEDLEEGEEREPLRPDAGLTDGRTDGSTHHKPGFPLAVSQKKVLKRSLELKLLSMAAQ